jgi:ABC-2 type transport system ATP-binding protein
MTVTAAATPLVTAAHLRRHFGAVRALDDVSFTLPAGRILGLLGPNGAGKTTLLRALLGLQTVEGNLTVLGHDPRHARSALMKDVAFIADVAVLPPWLRVREAVALMEGLHPKFNRSRCEVFLSRTTLHADQRVKALSKGMIVQLHLALMMAVDAKLMVLDEPTLGLDPLYRQLFYRALLEDYFDDQRTVIISTHQVEEVAPLLTDVAFMQDGRWIAHLSMEEAAERYLQVITGPEQVPAARAWQPLDETAALGRHRFIFDGVPAATLQSLGEVAPASLADLFVALMKAKASTFSGEKA